MKTNLARSGFTFAKTAFMNRLLRGGARISVILRTLARRPLQTERLFLSSTDRPDVSVSLHSRSDIKSLSPLPLCALVVLVGISLPAWAIAQTASVDTLYRFTGQRDGGFPFAGLTEAADGAFYGTTASGGAIDNGRSGAGTIFRITPTGGFSSLYAFPIDDSGNVPQGSVLVSPLFLGPSGILYGVASSGGVGTQANGTMFRISTDGVFAKIHDFTYPAGPSGQFVAGADGVLYGTTQAGGSGGEGSIYQATTSGEVTLRYSFDPLRDRSEGASPEFGLTSANDGTYYGITTLGTGSTGTGTFFHFTPPNQVTSLANFQPFTVRGKLVLGIDGNFYCATNGAILRISRAGVITRVYTFAAGEGLPQGLILGRDGNFYGVALDGGRFFGGTVFKISRAGTFSLLYEFGGLAAEGRDPLSMLVQGRDGNFYGITQKGGSDAGAGTVYRVRVLAITSGATATAVVSQHFSYHITVGSFNPAAGLTYSATGLPQGFVLNSQTGVISGVPGPGSQTLSPIFITLHVTNGAVTTDGELALTIGDGVPVLSVSDTGLPSGGAPGEKVLAFAVKYPGQLAGRNVFIEVNEAGTWHPLSTALDGHMTYDTSKQQYVLNSTNYPLASSVSFRARVTAAGYEAAILSNVVGPFNLASSKPRAGQTVFRLIRNGLRADLDFRVAQIASPPSVGVRVQSSLTPSDEGSWTDLTDARSGHMVQDTDPTVFSLLVNKYPPGEGIYFRAVASLSGSVDSLSNVIGPYILAANMPPDVKISSPAPSGSNTGQDPDHPILITVDATTGVASFNITASATVASGRSLAGLKILFDGKTRTTFANGVSTGSLFLSTNELADHQVEAVAVDDMGVRGRAGTYPLYVRILPPSATAVNAMRAGDGQEAAAVVNSKVFTVVKSGGSWDDASTWQDLKGNPGVPGFDDIVILGSSSVQMGSVESVGCLTINGGHLVGPGTLQVYTRLVIAGGSFDAFVHLIIKQGAVCELINGVDFKLDGLMDNHGTVNVHGERGLVGLSSLLSTGEINFQDPLLVPSLVSAGLPLGPRLVRAGSIDTSGKNFASSVLTKTGLAGVISNDGGSLVSHDGGTLVSNSGGTLLSDNGIGLVSHDGGTLITQDGGSLITQDGGSLVSHDGGTLVGNSGGTLNATGLASGGASSKTQADTAASGFTQTAGETDLSGITLVGPVTLNGGVFTGSGKIIGNLTNNGGYIMPGNSSGTMVVAGDLTQGSGGTLIVKAGGGEAGQFDRLQVGGKATLGGRLDVRTVNGYLPLPGDPFNPIGYKSVSGSFGSVSSNVQIALNGSGMIATLDPAKANPPAGQPLNIATRMKVLTNDNVLIAGFIVTGPSGSTKKVLIRGLGPSLAQFGVTGTLSDPLLELHKSDGTVINDNWQQGDTTQIPNGFAPGDPREAVIVATLAPGNYSAVVKGAHGETGVGIAELYDLDSASPAKLANISTRGFINTGDDVMIGGFIIGGNEPAKILVRVTGPTLSDFGVQGALADPTLELHDSNGATISNDDWRETQETEIIATTIAPNKDREPAILATLVPGNYTAVVRGKNNTTGVGLVEAYNLQ